MTRPDDDLDRAFGALSDANRRRIYAILLNQPGLTTGEVAERIAGISRWAVMKHLQVLRDSGLVQTLPDGRRRRHYSDGSPLATVETWLEANGGSKGAG